MRGQAIDAQSGEGLVCVQNDTTLVGLEPTRDKPNRFLVDRLNHSAKVSIAVGDQKRDHCCNTNTTSANHKHDPPSNANAHSLSSRPTVIAFRRLPVSIEPPILIEITTANNNATHQTHLLPTSRHTRHALHAIIGFVCTLTAAACVLLFGNLIHQIGHLVGMADRQLMGSINDDDDHIMMVVMTIRFNKLTGINQTTKPQVAARTRCVLFPIVNDVSHACLSWKTRDNKIKVAVHVGGTANMMVLSSILYF